ncbi:DUF5129 domain-containing protein [Corynebacterium sp. UBA2622]|uniref:DUF5129 domain-containing protein n=1 Tax=Corynebacterium sp. UBA2622 TaxID=1946393 RepID=UPI0025C235AB|nr:DUF5129 domain-containing protein [Corynebacterium sp. UBA2622]
MASAWKYSTVAGVAGLVALGVGGAAAAMTDVPGRDQVAVATTGAPRVLVDDPQDVLTPEDEARLESDARRLDVPDTVHTLHYLVLGQTRENVNDSVEEYLRVNRPEEIGRDKFADGVLIIGAGTDNRKVFAFAGEDVANQLYLRKGQRAEPVNDAIKPGMRDNNIPAALFAGASKATDAQEIEDYAAGEGTSARITNATVAGVGTGAATLAGGSLVVARQKKRREAIAQGRKDYELVTREYAELGQRLDEVDVRANSVSSAFADRELRKEWAEVRDRFLGMHEAVSGANGFGSVDVNDDKQVWDHHKQIAEAAESVRHVSTAEDNINRLFAMEQGDAAARRAGLTELRKDVKKANRGVSSPALRGRLADLEGRIDWLDRNPADPGFVDEFVRVLEDYRLVLDEVKEREFSDVKERNPLQRPRLYDNNYWYPSYVPYVMLSSWHNSNVQAERAAQQSASSGTNSSFSSGFSGAGGSSSY